MPARCFVLEVYTICVLLFHFDVVFPPPSFSYQPILLIAYTIAAVIFHQIALCHPYPPPCILLLS